MPTTSGTEKTLLLTIDCSHELFVLGSSSCPSRAALMTGRFAGDVSFNGNIAVGITSATVNPSHGFAYQLPTPAGDGASPWKGGLLNLGSLMQSNGYNTAHFG
jgi:arylsulfatase A-like enzyme